MCYHYTKYIIYYNTPWIVESICQSTREKLLLLGTINRPTCCKHQPQGKGTDTPPFEPLFSTCSTGDREVVTEIEGERKKDRGSKKEGKRRKKKKKVETREGDRKKEG